MPLSAFSPDGPVTLIGVDPLTVERMRERNRKEKIYTAKCCGAPVQIRTADGKIPHFVHLSTPDFCEGDRLETPEHLRLKQEIAAAVVGTDWEVETEARETDQATNQTIWRADVLATRKKAKVAFEVQLSNADWAIMSERQKRYRRSGVRGLWFVKTKKGFPATEDLPIFTLEKDDDADWVRMSRRWDGPLIWDRTEDAEYVELSDFIRSALGGHLKWAPYLSRGETVLNAEIYYWPTGVCTGCGRTLVRAHAVTAHVAANRSYPDFHWHAAMAPRARSNWPRPVLHAVWKATANNVAVAFTSSENTCCWCRAPKPMPSQTTYTSGRLSAQLTLGALPKPSFRTVEWDWLHRWVLM